MNQKHKNIIKYCSIILVGIAIAVMGVISKQSLFRISPLFISLGVSYLQSRVNKYAYLLGGLNSILYAVIYGYYHLYASMTYAFVVSFPLQIATFFRWKKHSWGNTTVFKKMTWKQRGLLTLGAVIAWGAVIAVLNMIGSDFVLLDTTLTFVGIIVCFLSMLAYIEYTALMVPSTVINIILAASMISKYPEQWSYLIYDIYCFTCQCIAFVKIRQVYHEQQYNAAFNTEEEKQ